MPSPGELPDPGIEPVSPALQADSLPAELPRKCAHMHAHTHTHTHSHTQWNIMSAVAQSCPTLCNPMDYSLPSSSVHGISQARITGVGCHFPLQEVFPTQGSNLRLPCFLYWQANSLPLTEPPGKPRLPFILTHFAGGGGSMLHACLFVIVA